MQFYKLWVISRPSTTNSAHRDVAMHCLCYLFVAYPLMLLVPGTCLSFDEDFPANRPKITASSPGSREVKNALSKYSDRIS